MAEIEKESLEAHVELCGERYKALHDKLDAVNSRLDDQVGQINRRLDGVEDTLDDIHNAVIKSDRYRNKQVLTWATAIIGTMAGVIGFLVWNLIK